MTDTIILTLACLGRITSSTELVTGDPTPALTRDGNRAAISPLDKRKEKNKREKRDPMLSLDQRDGRGRPANWAWLVPDKPRPF